MHDDRELVERRIEREVAERVLPLARRDALAMSVTAGPDRDPTASETGPITPGERWGEPWGTTWFHASADIPEGWCSDDRTRIEAVVDLGFDPRIPGFQAEGLVVDGEGRPVVGIHPRRTVVPVRICPDPGVGDDGTGGPARRTARVVIEAASNPSFPQFHPSPDGRLSSAPAGPRYRFRSADLVLHDVETVALLHDLDVAVGLMYTLAVDDPARAALRVAIVAALDRLPAVGAARAAVAPVLAPWPTRDGDRPHRVVATGHAHIDTAWLWPIRETIRKCTRTFASAVALADEFPEFVFSCSQAQQYAWVEERHPELFAGIVAAVDRGQWEPVGGMWVEADMNLPSGESLVRQIVHGQRWFESRFGRRCTEVWIPDVFGYPAGLPQVFAAGGMRRFVTQKLSWNKQNRFPHHTFWWEGLDGTRVLTHFPPVDTYNAEITSAEVVGSVHRFRDQAWSRVSLMPFGYGDGGGGPTSEMLERARRLAGPVPGTTVEIGRPSDVFDAVEREAFEGAPVPVWRGELYFETHRGTLTSQLRTKVGNRRCERLLVEAELWSATLGHGPDDELDGLWKEVLTQQFHDILPGSSIGWAHDDAEEVFERVGDLLDERIARDVGAVAGAGDRAGDGAGTASVLLANPTGTHRTEVVVLPAHESCRARNVRAQVLDGGDAVAVEVDVAPFGVVPVEDAVRGPAGDDVVVTDSSMSNGLLTVRWDSLGRVVSVIDVAAQRELVPEGLATAVIELAPDHPVEYDAWDLEAWTRAAGRPLAALGASTEVEIVEHGPLLGRLRTRCRLGPSTFGVTIDLRSGRRQLDVEVDVDWHHDEHLLSIAFPHGVRSDVAMCDVQFGVVGRPTHPSSPWDAAKFEVCAHRFVSVAEPSFGVAVLNDGRYGHCVFDDAIRVSLARAAKYPDPDADHGRHRVRLALRPHDGDLADVRAAAERLDRPLRVTTSATPTPVLPTAPLVALSGRDGAPLGVEVDAVKLADDGSGDVIVRLHEHVGDRCSITVAARERISSASRCDLLEDPIAGEESGDGVVSLTLRPFEIVTLRLELAPTD